MLSKLTFHSKVEIRKKILNSIIKELICNSIINSKSLSLDSNNHIDSYLNEHEVLDAILSTSMSWACIEHLIIMLIQEVDNIFISIL